MSAQENKAVIQRFVDALNQRDPAALDPFFAPGHVHHSGREVVLDSEGLKRGFAGVLAAIPDYRATLTQLIAEGEMVAAFLVVRGTHQGQWRPRFPGVLPVGGSTPGNRG